MRWSNKGWREARGWGLVAARGEASIRRGQGGACLLHEVAGRSALIGSQPRPPTSSSSSPPWPLGPVGIPLPAAGLADGARCGAHGRRCAGEAAAFSADGPGDPPAAAPAPGLPAPGLPAAPLPLRGEAAGTAEGARGMEARGVKLPLARSCERSDCCGSMA